MVTWSTLVTVVRKIECEIILFIVTQLKFAWGVLIPTQSVVVKILAVI